MAFRRASALLIPRLVAAAPAVDVAVAPFAVRRSPVMAALAVRLLHVSAPAAKLVDVLRREAEYERSNYEKTEVRSRDELRTSFFFSPSDALAGARGLVAAGRTAHALFLAKAGMR